MSMGIQVQIAALYAALNALVVFALAALVVRQRAKAGISIGVGPVAGPLHRAIRAHANAIEYVPLVLVLLVVLDLAGANVILLHVVGGGLLLGRLLHGFGLSRSGGISIGRSAGALLTWLALVVGSIGCLYYVFASP
jgi:uncharacterized membrane protein YecN with MAPEG domain